MQVGVFARAARLAIVAIARQVEDRRRAPGETRFVALGMAPRVDRVALVVIEISSGHVLQGDWHHSMAHVVQRGIEKFSALVGA